MRKRAIIIVLDSVGIGELPDSHLFGDEGANTLKNTALAVGGLDLPNLGSLGLGNIEDIKGVEPIANAIGNFGKMNEKSMGKDTTMGHWEMVGIITEKPFPTYPEGFPDELISEYEKIIGCKVIGNKAASGTDIIKELGEEHMLTGSPIVYTSADSVLQIAAHEEIIPLDKQYEMCEKARLFMTGEHEVGRIIARPFVSKNGEFQRTPNRQDYSLEPSQNILDFILENGQEVIGVGKIKDIYAGRGVSRSCPTKNNLDGIKQIKEILKEDFQGLLFANLVDFDQLYGHRNDPHGYAGALKEFDENLPGIMAGLRDDDILIITADHGCDPTTEGTDHSREYVPLLVYGKKLKGNINLGVRETFADMGQTVAEHLGVKVSDNLAGTSFYSLLK
ncbi:MAG TPA: phosphopentomutase [Syntrophomonadaceae bacterium]|nr:phosphopentomutase [Syntrophomonadaceae bacterium]